MYKAVVLDMDGTIIDSVSVIESSLRGSAAKWGIAVTEEMADAAKYSTNDHLYGILGGGERAAAFMKDWAKDYHKAAKNTKMFPGMEKVLEAPLRRAIVTSETEKELKWNLERLGVSLSLLECVAGADTTEHVKPHPRPLLYCLARMKIEAADALYVGDSLNDMRCAAAAGVSFALARFGENDERDAEKLAGMGFEGVDLILTRPEEILEMVECAE